MNHRDGDEARLDLMQMGMSGTGLYLYLGAL